MLRALMPADMDDVSISLSGDHSGNGAAVLEHGVGADRRAVQHMINRIARHIVS